MQLRLNLGNEIEKSIKMSLTVGDLIEALKSIPKDCEVFLTNEDEVMHGHIEIKALMEKGNSKPIGVFFSTVIDEDLERLINNN